MQFAVGDAVRWTSQAAGFVVEKTGEVIEVVPVGAMPTTKVDRPGSPRDHQSYVVRARRPNGRCANYWPKISYLEPNMSRRDVICGSGVQMLY